VHKGTECSGVLRSAIISRRPSHGGREGVKKKKGIGHWGGGKSARKASDTEKMLKNYNNSGGHTPDRRKKARTGRWLVTKKGEKSRKKQQHKGGGKRGERCLIMV